MDHNGDLYGTTLYGGRYESLVGLFLTGDGTAFKLKHPSAPGGKWTETVISNFGKGSDGSFPNPGLVIDKNGNLYGTTGAGGAYPPYGGNAFELKPPSRPGGRWTESVLWNLGNGDDGNTLSAGLTMDKSGNLYGTSTNGGTDDQAGTVFELTPPALKGGNWSESILWKFGTGTDGINPWAGLTMDAEGNLYGTTLNGGAYGPYTGFGTVFQLKPPSTPGGEWTESVLWSFGNDSDGYALYSGLVVDRGGNLYGVTACGGAYGGSAGGEGTLFELTPPSINGGNWTESILWNFGNATDGGSPFAGLIMDSGGNLYGTTGSGIYGLDCGNGGGTNNGGIAFELTPPAAIGEDWTESILWNFGSNGSNAYYPTGSLVMDASGNLLGTREGGAYGVTFAGTAFEISTSAILTTSPNNLNFGRIKAGEISKAKKVTLTNKGILTAQISAATATAPFAISGTADTCSDQSSAPNGTCSFYVEFAPTVADIADGSVDVIYNGTSPVLTLKGNGIAKQKNRLTNGVQNGCCKAAFSQTTEPSGKSAGERFSCDGPSAAWFVTVTQQFGNLIGQS